MLWADVKQHFGFPEDKEEIFKDWVMKKMAIYFPDDQEELEQRLHKEGPRARLREALQEATSFLGCICAVQTVRDQREKDSTSQREREQEDTLSSSWARRLFDGDPQMAENGRRPHCKGNRTDDFRLAAVSKAFLLRSWRLPKPGRWLAYY